MLNLGAEKRHLKTKAFGGGTFFDRDSETSNFKCVGEVNSRFIREFLGFERIPLMAENLGGKEGRVIHFSYGDFAVYVRRIKDADKTKC